MGLRPSGSSGLLTRISGSPAPSPKLPEGRPPRPWAAGGAHNRHATAPTTAVATRPSALQLAPAASGQLQHSPFRQQSPFAAAAAMLDQALAPAPAVSRAPFPPPPPQQQQAVLHAAGSSSCTGSRGITIPAGGSTPSHQGGPQPLQQPCPPPLGLGGMAVTPIATTQLAAGASGGAMWGGRQPQSPSPAAGAPSGALTSRAATATAAIMAVEPPVSVHHSLPAGALQDAQARCGSAQQVRCAQLCGGREGDTHKQGEREKHRRRGHLGGHCNQ